MNQCDQSLKIYWVFLLTRNGIGFLPLEEPGVRIQSRAPFMVSTSRTVY
jgi:hypothetical protein